MGDIWSAFVYLAVAVIVFIPILLWGYLFSYFDNTPFNGRRFVVGILGGIVSVMPILYLSDIVHAVGLDTWDILPFLAHPDRGIIGIIPSLIVLSAIIVAATLGASLLSTGGTCLRTLSTSLRNLLLFSLFAGVLAWVGWLVMALGLTDRVIANPVGIGSFTFGTVGTVILYYAFVGYSEELGKHFSFVASSLPAATTVSGGLLLAIFVALGFGCTENILYLHHTAIEWGLLDTGVFTTWIFRSIFSLLVHVLCTAVLANAFLKIYLSGTPYRLLDMRIIWTVLSALILSVGLHAVYDVSLTLGFQAIIFVYFLLAYFVVTGMFYRESAA